VTADEPAARLSGRAGEVALCLDFDGTLAPIVDDPDAARPLPGTVELLAPLAARFAAVALVSGHGEALAMVHEVGGDRVQVLDLENRRGRPVYVHAKLCVIDDVWALVGSANLNMRSWTYDSEPVGRDPGRPAGPAPACRPRGPR
jgi:hypothetical protein